MTKEQYFWYVYRPHVARQYYNTKSLSNQQICVGTYVQDSKVIIKYDDVKIINNQIIFTKNNQSDSQIIVKMIKDQSGTQLVVDYGNCDISNVETPYIILQDIQNNNSYYKFMIIDGLIATEPLTSPTDEQKSQSLPYISLFDDEEEHVDNRLIIYNGYLARSIVEK